MSEDANSNTLRNLKQNHLEESGNDASVAKQTGVQSFPDHRQNPEKVMAFQTTVPSTRHDELSDSSTPDTRTHNVTSPESNSPERSTSIASSPENGHPDSSHPAGSGSNTCDTDNSTPHAIRPDADVPSVTAPQASVPLPNATAHNNVGTPNHASAPAKKKRKRVRERMVVTSTSLQTQTIFRRRQITKPADLQSRIFLLTSWVPHQNKIGMGKQVQSNM